MEAEDLERRLLASVQTWVKDMPGKGDVAPLRRKELLRRKKVRDGDSLQLALEEAALLLEETWWVGGRKVGDMHQGVRYTPEEVAEGIMFAVKSDFCLLYTSDAADE